MIAAGTTRPVSTRIEHTVSENCNGDFTKKYEGIFNSDLF